MIPSHVRCDYYLPGYPVNDAFVNAAVLFDGSTVAPISGSIIDTGTIIDATLEPNEPSETSARSGGSTESTVWFTWTTPTVAIDVQYTVTFDTLATSGDIDTVIDVYQLPDDSAGTDITALTFVGGNDQGDGLSGTGKSSVTMSSLSVPALSSVTLYVRVGLWKAPVDSTDASGVSGPITVSWSAGT